jgi:hypothetical protein
MQIAIAFIGALALAIIVIEIGTGVQRGRKKEADRLNPASLGTGEAGPRLSTWEALLIAVLPGRFDPNQKGESRDNVAGMLRRAGYPCDTPGDFYVACIRTFTVYLLAGAFTAGAVYMLGLGIAAPFIAAGFIFLGLTRPYAGLKSAIKTRARAVRQNMLPGLAVLESLLATNVSMADALKHVGQMGGPFCNLVLYLRTRIDLLGMDKAQEAIENTRAHLPDPNDPEMQLFLKYVADFYRESSPLLAAITALRVSAHRNLLEDTDRRVSVVMQRTSLFGIFAVVGLILAIILPFMNM